MNILIQQTKAFPHRANSFYWFYAQLTEWLTANGVKSKLFFCYQQIVDSEFENGLLLPDRYERFYTPRNVEAVCKFIHDNDINVILDYSHVITGDTKKYYKEIRQKVPELKIFTMIHNCPSHTTQLKQYELSTLQLKEVRSIKQFLQWMAPQLYIAALKKVVSYQNRSAYDTMDEVVLLSPSYLPEFRKLIKNKNANRLSAIPNAIRPVKSEIPIASKNKEIVFVGRMTTEKALPKLLKIWEMIQNKLPDWHLTVVGEGPRYTVYQHIIKERRLQRVTFTGHQMAIPYIDRARIICLTSVIEGLPTVFIEAMSLGVVPVGFSSFNAIYDMIEHGKDGFIIPEDDYEQYAATLLRLAEDDELRQQIAATAQNRVNRYDINHVGPLWKKAFEKHGLIY